MMKTTFIAALLGLGFPFASLAQEAPAVPQPTPGHIAEARVLGLDPYLFNRTELAQISAEERLRDRRDRVRFILQMKDRRGELPPGFMENEAPRIIRSMGF